MTPDEKNRRDFLGGVGAVRSYCHATCGRVPPVVMLDDGIFYFWLQGMADVLFETEAIAPANTNLQVLTT